MTAFFEALLSPINLPLTVLLGLCLLYWLLVAVGGLTTEAFDVDLDADAGLDVDADADLDAADLVPSGGGGGGGGSVALASSALRFLNLGDVPLMIVLTVLILCTWAINVSLHPALGDWSVLAQLGMLVPIVIGAAVLTKVLTWPLKVLFRRLREEERAQALELVGKMCRVISSQVTPGVGQAEFRTKGAPLLLNVRTKDGDTLKRGQEAVIVGRDKDKNVYIVRGF